MACACENIIMACACVRVTAANQADQLEPSLRLVRHDICTHACMMSVLGYATVVFQYILRYK